MRGLFSCALAARLDAAPPAQFLAAGAVAAVACLAVSPLLLPSREDANDEPSVDGLGAATGVSEWFRGWSLPVAPRGRDFHLSNTLVLRDATTSASGVAKLR